MSWPPAWLAFDQTPSKPFCAGGEAAQALGWAVWTCQCPSNAQKQNQWPVQPQGVTSSSPGVSLVGGEHPGKSCVREKHGSTTCETRGSADYGAKGPHQPPHSRFFQSLIHGEHTSICLAAAPPASPLPCLPPLTRLCLPMRNNPAEYMLWKGKMQETDSNDLLSN